MHPFDGFFSGTSWVRRYEKGKTSLDLNEARDDGVLGCSGISWTICKQSAPRCRHQHVIAQFFPDWMLSLTPTTHPFNHPLSGITQVSRYQKGKTNLGLLKQETVSCSGISWAICKSAPRSRQITMPAPHHSVFYRPDALPDTHCQQY